MFQVQRSAMRAGVERTRTSFSVGGIIVPHGSMMSMLPRIVCNYEPRGLEETGELAGLSEGGYGYCNIDRDLV